MSDAPSRALPVETELELRAEVERLKGELAAAGQYTEAHERLDDLAHERVAAAEARATQAEGLLGAVRATPAIQDVLDERRRHVEVEGWTPEHDDSHGDGEMAQAAAVYALPASRRDGSGGYWTYGGRDPELSEWVPFQPKLWPWHLDWWKPKDRRYDLVRAAALILAEIERLDRAAALLTLLREGGVEGGVQTNVAPQCGVGPSDLTDQPRGVSGAGGEP